MSSALGKSSRHRVKSSQPKISDFGSADSSEVSLKAKDAPGDAAGSTEGENINKEILDAIRDLKDGFSNRLDGIKSAIDGVRKEISECTERIATAEVRISNAEDDVANLQTKVLALEEKKRQLEDKVTDLEARSRRLNLRLINLPEKEEGDDACAFLEKWIPEVLGPTAPNNFTLERAHRVGQSREVGAALRTMIMKFLNDRDKVAVLRAARSKKQILYKSRPIRFYPDLAVGVHQKQKEFDGVRLKLRNMGIRHGILVPAQLLVTYKGSTQTFKTPTEAEDFIRQIQENGNK